MRARVSQSIKRGKVDLSLRYEFKKTGAMELGLNIERVQQLFHLQSQLSHHHSTISEFSTAEILGFPGVLEEPSPDEESLQALALKVLEQTLLEINESRTAEGNRTIEFVALRAARVKTHIDELRKLLPEIRSHLRDKVTSKLKDLAIKSDPDRLEQELVFYAQRLDIDEELDRLDSHLFELNKTLKQNKPIGRRLDFLMQEFNREANTIASKSQNANSTLHAVELKVLIEQMREQIQNIE
jgi:uncharacterized protein (TIGR00255 family)